MYFVLTKHIMKLIRKNMQMHKVFVLYMDHKKFLNVFTIITLDFIIISVIIIATIIKIKNNYNIFS